MASAGRRAHVAARISASPGLLPATLAATLQARGFEIAPLVLSREAPPVGSPAGGRAAAGRIEVALLDAGALGRTRREARATVAAVQPGAAALIVVGAAAPEAEAVAADTAHAWLPLPLAAGPLLTAMRSALETAVARRQIDQAHHQLDQKAAEIQGLYEIGTALSAEQDVDRLQERILRRCRELTCADAGSLYLIDEDAEHGRALLFETAQNDSVIASYERLTMPLTDRSIAGYAALTGQTVNLPDVYQLPTDAPYHHNRTFDQQMGYRTRSLLAVPMRNHEGEIIGVIQLINRKRSFDARLRTPTAADRHVISFTAESERVLDAFAGQAAVVLDNRLLLQNIERLFEGFVRASVTAIEARDPTTSGHSARVAELTVRLANEISTIAVGRWKDVAFNEQQIREIRYAGLLHDFGKIGVRENVLVKARKLYDWQLDLIRLRFAYASKALEADYYRRRLDALLEGEAATPLDLDAMKASHHRQTHQLDEDLAAIVAANAPDVVDPALVARIAQARQRSYPHADGQDRPLIEEDELFSLSIRAGSLTVPERREIESHVAHTFRFLSLMPWTRPLRQLPLIAGSHHEKLDGSGYPRGLKGDEIPLQSRIMTIADIYDALTAADRPYRPAMPPTQALNILDAEAAAGRVDADLLEVFVQQRVYERPIR